jgi:hypothetical protein
MPGVPAADFLAKKPLWAPVFKTFTILQTEESHPWLQLVAHGVLMRDFTGHRVANLAAEFHTFNLTITFVGGTQWITQLNPSKQAGLVVFSVLTEESKKLYL